jgi:tetratricopeptide (TPR) repeat protein
MDMELQQELKDVSAEATMEEGQFDKADNFNKSLKDEGKTKELLQEDALAKSREYRIKEVEKSRLEYEAAPLDHRAINKYALALKNMEEEPFEAQAIEVLQKSYVDTNTYQYKRAIDELKIRQMRRQITAVRDEAKLKPEDTALRERLKVLQAELIEFELVALKDWADHYPSDMKIMFELSIRLFITKQYDEAIRGFQQAQNNPSQRVESLYYLGLSFDAQKMLPEAEETLRSAVQEYEMAETGNDLSKRLHYALARVYEEVGKDAEAMDVYSKITRWDIGYRDARARLAELRKKTAK